MLLSKSQYLRGLQCHKSLWLYKNRPELRDVADGQDNALFNTGHTVGDCAKQLFPGGVEIEFTPGDFDGMINTTAEHLEQGVETIYEAAFKEKGVFAMADVLHKTAAGWDIYEVKASTSVKPIYLNDAAIQYYALANVLKINRVFLVHINNKYERQGELDIKQLLAVEDITDEILAKQAGITQNLADMTLMLQSGEPAVDIGPQCSDPYDCDYKGLCWQHIPSPSVFSLYRMSGKDKFALYQNGILDYAAIPPDYKLNATQQLQVDSADSGEAIIDRSIIQGFQKTVNYPISFFDFESFQNAIPRFDNQRAYGQIPFQYSLHVMEKEGGLIHREYLADEQNDPRRELAESMLQDLPASGSIMAFNQSFEISRIKELAALFPDLRDALLALVPRFVDLIVPFRKLGYYHPDFNGSFSIKSVLPALFPNDSELDYKQLGIQDGGMAMDIFANLHLLKDQSQREAIRCDLLAYCRLDTLAMVRIWQKLEILCR
jgi:Domain of unknown function(DUF2779)